MATAVLVGVLTAALTGLGGRATDSIFGGGAALVSYGVEEIGGECGVATFLQTASAEKALEGPPPYEPEEWEAFQERPGAAPSGRAIVQVSIQGASARAITLTGFRIDMVRKPRRAGAAFSAACGDPLTGRGVVVDLEADPPKVISSSRETEGHLESAVSGDTRTAPIRFPWKVSISDPLLLFVVVHAEECDCRWSAEIPWVSGSEKGTIRIDNGGDGFRLVGDEDLPGYASTGEAWRRYR